MSNPYGQQPGYPQQPGGWSQPGQPGGYPPQQQQGGWPSSPQGYPPSQPGGWPQQQPGYPPAQQQAGWPPQSYAPQPPPKKGSGMIILIVVLVVLVGGGAAGWFLYLSPSHSNSPLFNRHGVPSNVPLPNGLTYDSQNSISSTDSQTNITINGTEWGWKVSGSSPTDVQQFYVNNLPGKGWTNVKSTTGRKGDKQVTACQGSNVLAIDAADQVELTDSQGKTTSTVTAPAGGAALGIAVITSSNPQVLTLLCTGQAPGA